MGFDFLLLGKIAPWFVVVIMAITVTQIIINFKFIWREFKNLNFVIQVLLVLFVIFGLAIRLMWVPNQDRIYFDEDRYLSYAVTFARFGQMTSINLATPEKLILGDVDTVARITVPVVNGLVLKIFGFEKEYLYITAKIFSTLQIISIFAVSYVLFRRQVAAIVASGIMAFVPVIVYWSTSTALDSYFVFFSILACLGGCLYGRKASFSSAGFLISTTVLLLFVRFEGFLMLPVIALCIWVLRKSEMKPFLEKSDLKYILMALPLVGLRALVSISVLGKTWCCGEATPLEAFSSGYFLRNTIPNVISLVKQPEFPGVIFIGALIVMLSKKDWKIAPLVLWFGFYFFIYSFYFAGTFFSVTYSGSYGRYFLMLVPPLAVLFGVGIDELISKFWRKDMKNKLVVLVALLVCVIALVPTFKNYKSLIYISPYDALVDKQPRMIQQYLVNSVLKQTPENSMYVHSLGDLVLLHGRATSYFSTFFKNEAGAVGVAEKFIRDGGRVFMMETYTCTVAPEKCDKILPVFELVPLEIQDEQQTGFAMLELKLKN